MSVWVNKDSKVIVQGITGGEGTKHTALMLKAGTNVVGGVNARKAGTTVTHGDVELPVFATVQEAMEKTGADVSIAFVPAPFTKDAMVEAIDAEIPLLVVITEGVPVQDTAEAWAYAQGKKTRIIGPNCPGIISPEQCLVGITPASGFVGPIGALFIGAAAGLVCLWGVSSLKKMLKYDDSLDAFGVHGLGGIVGAILTGVFASKAIGGTAGLLEGNPGQVLTQIYGILATIIWSGIATFVILKVVDLAIGLRVPAEVEIEGLDINLHGEVVQ